ncbi:MAG: DUF3536 domain-containing protein, partial [Desulfovibrio sp.]|nr:DUF3536 domain-containing protein [Desulfovibrio sp.]
SLAADHQDPLLSLATDGETYGHHFTFGEMALAHVLAQARAQRDGLRLTNLAAYIAAHPPVREALLQEPSSWSCVHGVERWRSDCGCTDGGHPGWNQKWRSPLRLALNTVRDAVESHFAAAGCLPRPRQALLAYGRVLAGAETKDAFAAAWFRDDSPQDGGLLQDRAWKLLAAQEQSLAAFASCAWFFDDLARIEPENALTCALRAMDLLVETGGPDIREDFLLRLDPARSNQAGKGSGREVFLTDILPRQVNAASICLLACLLLRSQGRWPAPGLSAVWSWPRIRVSLTPENGPSGPLRGTAVIRAAFESRGLSYAWEWTPPSAILEEEGGFLSLSQTAITVRAASGREQRRSVAELSKPMRDYLQGELLANREQLLRPRLRAQARHLLALAEPWPEEQRDVRHSFLLAPLAPYLALECVLDADLAAQRRDQVHVLLARHLSPDGACLAARLLEEELQGRLAAALASSPGAPADGALAALVRQAKDLVPLEVWALQNRLWEAGPQRFPALAGVLGFSQGNAG